MVADIAPMVAVEDMVVGLDVDVVAVVITVVEAVDTEVVMGADPEDMEAVVVDTIGSMELLREAMKDATIEAMTAAMTAGEATTVDMVVERRVAVAVTTVVKTDTVVATAAPVVVVVLVVAAVTAEMAATVVATVVLQLEAMEVVLVAAVVPQATVLATVVMVSRKAVPQRTRTTAGSILAVHAEAKALVGTAVHMVMVRKATGHKMVQVASITK
mmetsp:Transcript_41108/g.106223  ORF Transcript_41108/g.106223 Transcript_41108/m.106223 type:complete len:215 (-) Transcript_41108:274-918(-)